jgi:hypothetical protein
MNRLQTILRKDEEGTAWDKLNRYPTSCRDEVTRSSRTATTTWRGFPKMLSDRPL